MRTNPIIRRTAIAALASAVALSTAACSDASDAAEEAASGEITVQAVDYAFGDLPRRIEAGSTLSLTNESDSELHELVAIRVPDDEQRSAEELLALPPDELAGTLFPHVKTVLLVAPGSDEVIPAVGDGTLTEPGRYLFICAIPTGADPQEYLEAAATSEGPPQVDGGPPHLAQGMWAEVEVVAP